jgi:hypothetical protein
MSTHHTCGACGRRVRINANGTLRIHLLDKRDHLGVRLLCPGSAMTVAE